jgi:hypothetical protein
MLVGGVVSMLRRFFALTLFASLAAHSGLAPSEVLAQTPVERQCKFEEEKNRWLTRPEHSAFATAKVTFDIFDQTFPSLSWKSFASEAARPEEQPAAEAFKERTRQEIANAKLAYGNILNNITGVRKRACDVCLAVRRYETQVEPVTKAGITTSSGTPIKLDKLTLLQTKDPKISEQLTVMYKAVVVVYDMRAKIAQEPAGSVLALYYRNILLHEEGVIRNAYDAYLQAGGKAAQDDVLLHEALYGPNNRYDCIF